MDPDALKNSWALVAKTGDEVPLFFYSHLFLSHPEVREMFPVSMAAQRDKLVTALGSVVSNATQLDQVVPFLQQLGRDHRRFGAVAEHYSAVGASLLATLQHFLGAAWTSELAADWAEAYGLVATVMVQAAEESAADDAPAWWSGEVLGVDRRTMDVTIVQIRPERPLGYRPGQSVAIEIPYRPRRWRYYSPANAPRPDGSFELHIGLVPGGQVSGPAVRSLKKGDPVRIGAPVGDSLKLPDSNRDLVLVAGGTGLAPFRAMLEELDRRTSAYEVPQVHLFHGARMPWNLYEHKQLTNLTQRPWFSYTPVVSDDASYPGRRGQVGAVAASQGPWTGRTVLVCGSQAMIRHTVAELTAAGVPATDIHTESLGITTSAGSQQ